MTATDGLIAQGKLNEALLFLADYLKQHPENLDGVQRQIDKIFALRSEYSDTAKELFDVIVNDPLNDEKKLELISKLENHENEPSKAELLFIAETKAAAQFTYYRAVFDAIMNEGSQFIEQQRFVEAVRRFADGFVLYRDEFYFDFQGSDLLKQTDIHLSEVSKALNAYEVLQHKIAVAFKTFNSSLSVYNIAGSLEAYKMVNSVLHEYAALRNVCIQAGLSFRIRFAELKEQNPELTEASFLPFAYRFLLGRESNPNTGIVRAMDAQWDFLCAQSRALLTALIEKYSGDIALELSSDSGASFVAGTKDAVRNLSLIADMGKKFISLHSLLEQNALFPPPFFYASYNSALDYNNALLREVQKLFERKESFNSQKNMYADISVPSPADLRHYQGFASYSNSVSSYAAEKITVAKMCRTDMGILDVMRSGLQSVDFKGGRQEFSLPPWEKLHTALSVSLNFFANKTLLEGICAWEDLSSLVAESSTSVRKKYTTLYNEYKVRINEDLNASVLSCPAEASIDLKKLKQNLVEEIKVLSARFDVLSQAPEEPMLENPGSELYAANIRSASGDLAFFKNLSVRIDESSQLAKRRVAFAQQAKNEADFRYSQSLAALQREDFDGSRKALQQARDKYNESLLYQSSETLRVQTDKKLSALGTDIVRLENNKVVRDVRILVTGARNLYHNGDFEQAERLVLQAEDRWAVTNIHSNTEIVNLKALISNALSIRTGRYVPVTDPLYPEISQTLNVAHQYFEQGLKKINSGNRSGAMKLLNEAREKIKNVQVLYPLNQEANLLTLRIAQLISPTDFKEHFKQRYAIARREYRNPATMRRAYADLKDLYEINPGYPGLKQFIYNVEIELGFIVLPPDPKKIARSGQLVAEAERLYKSSALNEMVLNTVLDKLDEALILNPENNAAMVLVDRVQTGMGGRSLIVLSAEDEMLYQQAVQELSKGNAITAAALIAVLWQNTKLRNSAKIIDLKSKVDSLL